jgi:hypothetical protein
MKKDFRTKNLLSESALVPTFIEHNECVFLEHKFSEEKYHMVLATAQRYGQSRSDVEFSINNQSICDLFLSAPADPTERLLKETGKFLQELWKSSLHLQFPERSFEVWYYASADYPLTSEITFFQKEPGITPPHKVLAAIANDKRLHDQRLIEQ